MLSMVSADGIDQNIIMLEDDVSTQVGLWPQEMYDCLSIILSNMAWFVLCHHSGSVCLNPDMLLLCNWEELGVEG
jgi:hypothetical protein